MFLPMTKQWRDAWVSRRLVTCDYKATGEYFVTICTLDRTCLFDEIANGAMQLSPEGRIAENAWRNLPAHFPNIALDAFVIMPNHIHGILVFCAEGPALGIVVGGFKAEVSRRLGRRMWQRYYYDHVIRSKRELDQIRSYLAKNPACWATDEENSLVRGRGGQARLLRLPLRQ
jgi:putative transposase